MFHETTPAKNVERCYLTISLHKYGTPRGLQLRSMWRCFLILNLLAIPEKIINAEPTASIISAVQKNELNCKDGTWLSSSVCIPKGYIKGEAPQSPTLVLTKIEINNIREVNDKKMRITIDFYQELAWNDNRLKMFMAPNTSSVLNNNLINSIWKPDLWIKSLFGFQLSEVLEPTGGFQIMDESFTYETEETKRNTLVSYNMEAQATVYCNFNFFSYPMDTQRCEFIIDAAYPTADVVNLSFMLGMFGVTNNNFNLDDFIIDVTFKNESGQTGIHSIIQLERCVLPFIIRYYIPCIAIISVSLMNFLISIDSIPARTALLVTQFLTLTNILIAQQVKISKSFSEKFVV